MKEIAGLPIKKAKGATLSHLPIILRVESGR